MNFDTVVGFRLEREFRKGGDEVLSFFCNHCEKQILKSLFSGNVLLCADTYNGIQGYLQLHLMECEKYRDSIYKEKDVGKK